MDKFEEKVLVAIIVLRAGLFISVKGCVSEFEKLGGFKQLIIDAGKEMKDIKKEIDKEKINEAFTQQAEKQSKKVLEITKEKLVSIDFNHNSASAIIDSSLTSVVGKNMGKISAWYDNEWGFSNRMCDIAEHLHKIS